MVPMTEGSPSPPSVPPTAAASPETGPATLGTKALRSYPPHTENEPECPVITLW